MFFGLRIPIDELEFELKRFIKEKKEPVEALRTIDRFIDECTLDGNTPENAFFQRLTLLKGLLVFEAEIVWADECRRKLEELRSK